MALVPGAKKMWRGEDEEGEGEELLDRISRLPDAILGEIVSLLPIRDGGRTQVLSSRWRHIWRSAPLNIDLSASCAYHIPAAVMSRILSAHQGPARRFSIRDHYLHYDRILATILDGWLESPALDRLQELQFRCGRPVQPGSYCDRHAQRSSSSATRLPPLPASVRRFSSTLVVACFGGCSFPDGNDLQFPVVKQLSLWEVRFSETSLHALLAACPVLQSLLLVGRIGCSCVRIVCPALRSIGVGSDYGSIILDRLIIEDAPNLERLLCFDPYGKGITISVISAPKLLVLGPLPTRIPRLEFGSTVLKGSSFVSINTVVHGVKVLSITHEPLSLEVAIEFMKCFPCLEKLYIKINLADDENVLDYNYKDLIGDLDIRIKKLVLEGYQGSNVSHVNFAKFFVLNARMLESMRLHLRTADPGKAWIDNQHRLLEMKNKASRDLRLDVAYSLGLSFSSFCPQKVHDLSTADPFA